MIRIAMPWIIDATAKFDQLQGVSESMAKTELYIHFSMAKTALDQLYVDSIYRSYLRVSSQKAHELAQSLQSLTDALNEDWETEIEAWRIAAIRSEAQTFQQILTSELGTLPSFLVLPKGSFDVGFLTEQGEAMFPPDTAEKVPGTLADMKQAAKALAYELPTASGFHIFRVLEAVLRAYWDQVTDDKAHPNSKTIGMYAEGLRKGQHGDVKIWEALKQVKDLHRNPLAHPEVILSTEEAIGIVGIAYSVISEMLRSMPEAPSTTANPPA